MSVPISLRLDGRRALVVGEGAVALRRARDLLDAGAVVRVISPAVDAGAFESLGAQARLRPYRESDFTDCDLAVGASDDDATNARFVSDARRLGVPAGDNAEWERASHHFRNFSLAAAKIANTVSAMRSYAATVFPDERVRNVLAALIDTPLPELVAIDGVEAEHLVETTIQRLFGTARTPTTSAVCATRASALAMVQSRTVAAKLALQGLATTLLTVTTTGDRIRDRALTAIGAESLFVKELELALSERRADYAVHSCKDLPTRIPADFVIAAISQREDPRDAFCSERYSRFDDLPVGAVVGTSSLRRRAQLAARRPDLTYRDIRGNVDTRLRKLRDGEYDAIVLAFAGLRRLGASARFTVPFEVHEIVPAVGQGALAIEARAEDAELIATIRRAINDDAAEVAVACERAALRELQGGCQAPIGIHAQLDGDELVVDGTIARLDGTSVVRAQRRSRRTTIQQAQLLGIDLGHELLRGGGDAILARTPRPAALPETTEGIA